MNMMSNHTCSDRPITDMQDKYCGDCYEDHHIQRQYKGNHKRGGAAEGRAISFVVAANGRQPLGLHVPSPFGHCALARKVGPGGLPPGRGFWGGPSLPPGKQGGLGGRRPPNAIPRQTQNQNFTQVNAVAGCSIAADGRPAMMAKTDDTKNGRGGNGQIVIATREKRRDN